MDASTPPATVKGKVRPRSGKAPAFQFYVKDWLTSSRVRCMSLAARGLFIDLLAWAWENYGLPADEDSLRRMAACGEATWQRLWTQVSPHFELDAKTGRLVNPKMETIRAEMAAIHRLRSAAARKRDKSGIVYAALKPLCGRIKIGFTTKDPERRASTLTYEAPPGVPKGGHRDRAQVLAQIESGMWLERKAHADLAAYCVGGEWFTDCGEVRFWIEQNLSKVQAKRLPSSASSSSSSEGREEGRSEGDVQPSPQILPFPQPDGSRGGELQLEPDPVKPEKKAQTGFNEFWAEYPRRKGKADAQRAWAKSGAWKSQGMRERVMATLRRDREEWTAQGRTPEHLPYPATWLNRNPWLDDPEPQAVKSRQAREVQAWLEEVETRKNGGKP